MTIQEFKNRIVLTEKSSRNGCFLLCPPVKLLDTNKGNEVVTADMVDVDGAYRNHVHIKERGFWWPIEIFQFSA